MAEEEYKTTDRLRHADLSTRSVAELSATERAELSRRFDHFMRHFRAGKLGAMSPSDKPRQIRKWRP